MFTIALILVAAALVGCVLYRFAPRAAAPETPPPALAWDLRPFGAGLLLTAERSTRGGTGLASLSARLFAFDRLTGEVLETISAYDVDGSETGGDIGGRFDLARLSPMIERAEFVVTHDAAGWKDAYLGVAPDLAGKAWACSLRDVEAECPAQGAETALGVLKRRGADGRPVLAQLLEKLSKRGCAVGAAR